MAVKKSPSKSVAKKAVVKKVSAPKPIKKSTTAKPVKPLKKAAVAKKKEVVSKPAPKKPVAKPVKKAAPAKKVAAHIPAKSKAPINKNVSKSKMITKTKPSAGNKFADDKFKKAPVVEKKPVKKEEPVRMTRKVDLKGDPKTILTALPKAPIKPFTRTDVKNFGVQEKLQAIYYLQQIHSHIDQIEIIRGELPMEVKDLTDEVAALQIKFDQLQTGMAEVQDEIARKKQGIKDSNAQIKKYETQQMNVKNNREFDSLTKEIEFQQLEIQLCEKRIKEYSFDLANKTRELEEATKYFEDRKTSLEQKKKELDTIINETIKEEEKLQKQADESEKLVDENILKAYKRIRHNMANGLAVVKIERDSCGGCFNKLPPQLQLEIAQRRRFTFCEHCGRIIVDATIDDWE